MRPEEQLTDVSEMVRTCSSERAYGRDFLRLRTAAAILKPNYLQGKWSLCLQIINQEAHPKWEYPRMPTTFLVVSDSTSWSFCLSCSTCCLWWEGKPVPQDKQKSTRRMTVLMWNTVRGYWLKNQRVKSIYQQVPFGQHGVFVSLNWETAYDIWMLAALEKVEGLEGRPWRFAQLRITASSMVGEPCNLRHFHLTSPSLPLPSLL